MDLVLLDLWMCEIRVQQQELIVGSTPLHLRATQTVDSGLSQHFYKHLNAFKTARIENREDYETLTVAKIGGNGDFCVLAF